MEKTKNQIIADEKKANEKKAQDLFLERKKELETLQAQIAQAQKELETLKGKKEGKKEEKSKKEEKPAKVFCISNELKALLKNKEQTEIKTKVNKELEQLKNNEIAIAVSLIGKIKRSKTGKISNGKKSDSFTSLVTLLQNNGKMKMKDIKSALGNSYYELIGKNLDVFGKDENKYFYLK